MVEGSKYSFKVANIAKKINTKEEVEELCADLLMENNELQEITLSGPSYSLEACKVISNMIGKYTTLERAELNDMFVGRLMDEVPSSVTLLVDSLTNSPNLKELNLSDNAFGPPGVKAIQSFLADNHSINVFKISNCGLGPEGSELLGETLECSKINLKSIHIGRNRLENKGAISIGKALKRMGESVKIISIPQNGIKKAGMEDLLASLLECPNITSLDLSDNWIKSSTGPQLMKLLEISKYIQILNLSDSNMGEELTLEDLNLGYNEIEVASTAFNCLEALLALKELKKISFVGNIQSKLLIQKLEEIFEGRGIECTFREEENEEEDEEEGEDEENAEIEGKLVVDIYYYLELISKLENICL